MVSHYRYDLPPKPKYSSRRPPHIAYGLIIFTLFIMVGFLGALLIWQTQQDEPPPDTFLVNTQVAVALTQTALVLPSPTETPSMTPSPTLTPTITPSLTSSPSATFTPTPTPTPFQIMAPTSALDLPPFANPDETVAALAWSSNNQWIGQGTAFGVKVYDVKAIGAPPLELTVEAGAIYTVVFSRDGRYIFAAGADGQIRRWDLTTQDMIMLQRENFFPVWSLAYSNDNAILAVGEDNGTISLWDGQTLRQLHTKTIHQQPVVALAFSPDNKRLASGSYDGQIFLLNPEDLSTDIVWQLSRNASEVEGVRALAFSSNGIWLATGGDNGSVRIWDVNNGRESGLRLSRQEEAINVMAFHPQEDTLVFGGDSGRLTIMNVSDGNRMGDINFDRPIVGLAFDPNPTGSQLAVLTLDGLIQLWDTTTWQLVQTIEVR